MRITQGTGIDLSAARLDAVRTAGGDRELTFTVPEEEPEPRARRAREERDRERETAREAPSVERSVEAAMWAVPSVAAPSKIEPPAAPPSALDREPRKTPVAGDAPRESARAEGRASAPAAVKRAGPAASEGPVEGRPEAVRSAHGADGAKARSVDPLPEVEGATPAPEAASSTAGQRPAEAVASAPAQVAVEAVTLPAAAPAVSAAAASATVAAAPKGSPSDPALPEARAKGAPPATSSLPTVTGALPTESQRQSDNGLTPVKGSAPATLTEGDNPLRSRLQDALRSSVHQRVLQQPASGEVVLPGLGRVAVTARAADSAVAVEVHAAQSATAQLLHASAGDIAADVLAAEIPLSTLTFAGAGTWTRSDGHGPPSERDPSAPGAATDEPSATPPGRSLPAAPGRVRIVL